jgi:hypothetical protein
MECGKETRDTQKKRPGTPIEFPDSQTARSCLVTTPPDSGFRRNRQRVASLVFFLVAWTLTGTGFSTSGGMFPVKLNHGQRATLDVQLDPVAAGASAGQLTVTSLSSTNATAVNGVSGTDKAYSSFANVAIGTAPGIAIPATFMGWSHEWGTAQYIMGDSTTGVDHIYRQLLQNLMAYGSGPILLRIGGDSSDKTPEPTSTTAQPFAELAKALGVKFYLGVNLGSDNVELAVAQAKAYVSQMPPGSLDAVEIGNEPDS